MKYVAETVMAWVAVIVQRSLFPWLPTPSVTQPELSMEQYALPEVTESSAPPPVQRGPQSMQSLPTEQIEYSDPDPPSSQSPSDE